MNTSRTLVTALLISLLTNLLGAVEYKIQPNDTIRMVVFQEDKLTTESLVSKSGTVSLPLIGTVKVASLTTGQSEEAIKKLYELDYLVNAHVNISVISFARKFVTVGGEVSSPKMILFPEEAPLDLHGAIAQAGGLLENANQSAVIVRRASGSTTIHDLKSNQSPKLTPGDTITVTRKALTSSSVTVTGLVKNPGSINYPKTGKLDVLTAIAEAGGMAQKADRKSAILKRTTGGRSRTFSIDLLSIEQGTAQLLYLQPGDMVIIKESRF